MHVVERGGRQNLVLSATDLANFLGCRHRTALDIAVAYGRRDRAFVDDPLLEALRKRGLDHEKRYVDLLRAGGGVVVDLASITDPDEQIKETREAMAKGVDVIVQGALADGPWLGRPDVMCRVSGKSSILGDWSYEISDTKLAKETKAGTLLQLGLYSELLGVVQETRPEYFHVITPNETNPKETYRVDDYAAYFRLVKAKMVASVVEGDEALARANYPEPVAPCAICQWAGDCTKRRHRDDHLSLVSGISRTQRHELVARGVSTVRDLAGLPLPIAFKPRRGSREGLARVREQARVQVESRGLAVPKYEFLPLQPERGFRRLPEPTPGDLFVDLEGDPMATEGGREYLFGVVRADGSYESAWALNERDERRGFEWLMDLVTTSMREHPAMHVYHYAPYEPSAFKRLMGRYATRERELDAMLRSGRFIDLYAVVHQGMRVGIERYSVKSLEPLYGFVRGVPLPEANRSLRRMEYALQMNLVAELDADVRPTIEGYNRDDCLSTLRLRDWLEVLRAERVGAGEDIPRAVLADGDPSPDVDERTRRVEALRARLLAGIPEVPGERDAEQQGRWILAYLLDYHRREDKATWWEYFRLCDLPEDELLDEREALSGMQFVERLGPAIGKKGKPTRSIIDRYTFPEQEFDIDPDEGVKLQDHRAFGTVVAVDRARRTVDVRKGPSVAEVHPPAMFAFTHVSSDVMEDALGRIGESVASGGDAFGAARALLGRRAPRLRTTEFSRRAGESELDFALRICGELDATVLPIQGPPGAGKTHCGARLICALVRAGKRVGVTANSHKVIEHLLAKTAEAAEEVGVVVRLGHKNGDDAGDANGVIREFGKNEEALDALKNGEINVLGATSWLWARADATSSVDVLFVDEAGQLALANAVAVSQAANSLVLLGDPQQLEQPRKGSHPDGVGVSALDHVLGGLKTIPDDRGIFLPVTWRLSPAICDFTSELFYDGRLSARSELARSSLVGADGLPASGLAYVEVPHEGNRNVSDEEVEVVARVIQLLANDGVRWMDGAGEPRPFRENDVLVVAPYNAQVTRLAVRLAGTIARVGTVDKFQGQEAPVVIYSMAASRPEDAPRGMEFLYSLNRLNVATSRAKCLAIVVASPELFEPGCQTPSQMKLANALCRFRELATRLDLAGPVADGAVQWPNLAVRDPLANT
jgi:uncharacterized protein